MNILCVIPARYASSRFPGKPLAMIEGKTMIQRVYEQASKASSLNEVVVATDDARILEHVIDFGGKAVLTSLNHRNGTERCHEALGIISGPGPDDPWDLLVNIQGDEPFVAPAQIDRLTALFSGNRDIEIGTLAVQITDREEIRDTNVVKVTFTRDKKALYFSRSPIPYLKNDSGNSTQPPPAHHYKHLGMYAYRTNVLEKLASTGPSPLEQAESLEQLRWLENGYNVYIEVTDIQSLSIDTPSDLLKITGI